MYNNARRLESRPLTLAGVSVKHADPDTLGNSGLTNAPAHCIDITASHQCCGRVICDASALHEPLESVCQAPNIRYGHVPVPIGVLCHHNGICTSSLRSALSQLLLRPDLCSSCCPTDGPPFSLQDRCNWTFSRPRRPWYRARNGRFPVKGRLRLSIGEKASNIPSGLISPSTESPPVMPQSPSSAPFPKATRAL